MKKKENIIPDPLYDDIKAHHVVLFAGAGVSTEAGPYGSPTFYDIIKSKAKYPKKKPAPSFPELMQYFCEKIDGGQRNRLTREILDRIAEFSAPGEINNFATMFHHLVAEIPYFNRVVTTNWDPFFERSMNVLVPMIEDKDLAFWDDKKRQIIKIHGCVTRPYTLVATTVDYKSCIQRYPLIFNKLRDLITTKTVLFAGYGLADSDFRLILDEITSRLGNLRKLAYAFDPNASDDSIEYWQKRGVTVLKHTGVALLYELRERLEQDGLKPSRKFIVFMHKQANRISNIHHKRHNLSSPGAMISAMYQDGLLHSLNEVFAHDHLGQDDDLAKTQSDFEKTLKEMKKKNNLVEIAYYTGRIEVLQRFQALDKSPIPAYFDVGRLKPSNTFRAYKRKAPTKPSSVRQKRCR